MHSQLRRKKSTNKQELSLVSEVKHFNLYYSIHKNRLHLQQLFFGSNMEFKKINSHTNADGLHHFPLKGKQSKKSTSNKNSFDTCLLRESENLPIVSERLQRETRKDPTFFFVCLLL